MELKGAKDKELQPLPVGVWERIVKSLEDSRDIQTLIKVCPSLEDPLQKDKCRWLFDQIIPHLRPWLYKKELLNCRRVCKRWCHGVENYLENHPARRAFDPCNHVTGQLWLPEVSRAYDARKNYQKNSKLLGLFHWPLIPGSGNWDWLTPFLHGIGNHPRERSPFIGRFINFDFQYGWTENSNSADDYWNAAMVALLEFGSHVWFITFLEIEPDEEDPLSPLQTCQWLLEILHLLPNLKSLTLESWDFAYKNNEVKIVERYLESRRDSFPPLPHLETLKVTEHTPPNLVDILIRRYSAQIRRLSLPRCLWREDYSGLFPRLTEFHLGNISHKEDALRVLLPLYASNLWSLRLESIFDGSYDVGNNIIRLLSRFPRLHSFQLKVGLWMKQYEESAHPLPITTRSISSLKSLKIEGNLCGMNFNFLQRFPSLEYLSILSHNKLEYFDDKEMSDAIVWESMLPKLKELTLAKGDDEGKLHLNRSMFEWLKNGNVMVEERSSDRRMCSIV